MKYISYIAKNNGDANADISRGQTAVISAESSGPSLRSDNLLFRHTTTSTLCSVAILIEVMMTTDH